MLSCRDKVYSPSTTNIKKLKPSSIHACLVLFSLFCAIGSGLKCRINSGQVVAASLSILSNAVDSYHQVNSLYDGTINCVSTLMQASVVSNETFNYMEAMQQSDYHDFIKAMVHEVDNHETRQHWTLTKRCDLPTGTMRIMSIWSFKRK